VLVVAATRGLFMVWVNDQVDWKNQIMRERRTSITETGGAPASPQHRDPIRSPRGERGDASPWKDISFNSTGSPLMASIETAESLAWDDIFHVVIIASYKTPTDVLENTIEKLEEYSQASSHMGLVLALEQREDGAEEKFYTLRRKYKDRFRFVTATFHPPNIPNHIKGKASNMCWAFEEMTKELASVHGFCEADQYRIIVTNIDDDSEMHENYFEALTAAFLRADCERRYLTIWQPPVAQFKNLMNQPAMIRISTLVGSLADLSRHANPLDCHTPFSSNSISLVLALAVGGWDPDWVSDDWHMMAKCAVMTEGRAKCESLLLPMVNYVPEEESYWGTLSARWTQAKRHALGVSEVVYLSTSIYVGLLEVPNWGRAARFWWRIAPMLSKFVEIHFVQSLMGVWPPLTTVLISCSGMWWSSEIAEDQVVFNGFLAHCQQKMIRVMITCMTISMALAVIYFQLVKHRCNDSNTFNARWPICFWVQSEIYMFLLGMIQQTIYGTLPEWIAATRIVFQLKIDHAVAAMIGRPDMGEGF